MGVTDMWPKFYAHAMQTSPVPNIVQFIHDQDWVLGVDVPIAVRHRWHAGKEPLDCVESILRQHEELTTRSDFNPHPIKRIVYVFDNPTRNPLKVHEHKRREETRKQSRANYEARQTVLSMVENGVTEIPDQLRQVNVVNKLLGKHSSICVDETTSTVSVKTNLHAVADDIRKKHKLDVVQPVVQPLLEGPNGPIGIAPATTTADRKERPPTEIYSRLIEEFEKRGIPYEVSPDESEHLLAVMCQRGEIDVVVTTDSDALLFGAPRVLKNFNPYACDPTQNQLVELKDVLSVHNITREQLVDIGIMAGCDFTEAHLPGIGVCTAYKEILKYDNIEGVIKQPKGYAALMKLKRDGLSFDFKAARALFLADDIKPLPKPVVFKDSNIELPEPLFSVLADVRKWNAGLYAQVEALVALLPDATQLSAWHTIGYRHVDDEPDCVGLVLSPSTTITILDTNNNTYTFMAPGLTECGLHTFWEKFSSSLMV